MVECQPHQIKTPDIFLLSDLSKNSTLIDGLLAQIHCITALTKKGRIHRQVFTKLRTTKSLKKLLLWTLPASSLPGWCSVLNGNNITAYVIV